MIFHFIYQIICTWLYVIFWSREPYFHFSLTLPSILVEYVNSTPYLHVPWNHLIYTFHVTTTRNVQGFIILVYLANIHTRGVGLRIGTKIQQSNMILKKILNFGIFYNISKLLHCLHPWNVEMWLLCFSIDLSSTLATDIYIYISFKFKILLTTAYNVRVPLQTTDQKPIFENALKTLFPFHLIPSFINKL